MLQGLDVDDLDGGIDTQEGYRSLRSGPPPEVRFFATAREEAAFLKENHRGRTPATQAGGDLPSSMHNGSGGELPVAP